MRRVPSVYRYGMLVGALILMGIAFHARWQAVEMAKRVSINETMTRQFKHEVRAAEESPGDSLMSEYAAPDTRPQDDLHALAHSFSNLTLLIKGDAPFPMGANEEFASALQGKNAHKLPFLSASHRAFNEKGQLIDRWNTPLFFHVSERNRIDIRSAGSDRKMWTADDLHRRYDGTFLKGAALNPPSLFEVRK